MALVYGKVRAALGIRQGVVSGGGSLAPHLDDFYEAIGLPVINGWGLTVRNSDCRALYDVMHEVCSGQPCLVKFGDCVPLAAFPLPARPVVSCTLRRRRGSSAEPRCGAPLQETSPVLACRRNLPAGNVRGSVGLPVPGTSLRVVDPEALTPVQDGSQGLILARGPGVMQARDSARSRGRQVRPMSCLRMFSVLSALVSDC